MSDVILITTNNSNQMASNEMRPAAIVARRLRHFSMRSSMSLFNMLSVSASGMAAQRTRLEVMVENMANSETTRTPGGGPYRANEVIFESAEQSSPFASIFQREMAGTGVKVGEIMEDMGEPEKRFIPGHPDADKDGYVAFPRINPAMDMADMMSAMRGYEANVSAMGLVKNMINRTVDLIK